jgi:hypothetical protein
MNERRAEYFEGYITRNGRDGSFNSLSENQRTELCNLILQAVLLCNTEPERRELVMEATGVSPLAFSMGTIELVNEGILERGTLKFERKG